MDISQQSLHIQRLINNVIQINGDLILSTIFNSLQIFSIIVILINELSKIKRVVLRIKMQLFQFYQI